MTKKAFMSPVELAIIFLAASIGVIYLSSLASSNLETQNEYYNAIYTENLLSSVLKYKSSSGKFENSTQLELLTIYACNNNEEIKQELEANLIPFLDNLSRGNSEYIFFMDGNNDFKVYSSIPNVCLEELRPAVFDTDTLCGEAKIILGTWKTDEQVKVC